MVARNWVLGGEVVALHVSESLQSWLMARNVVKAVISGWFEKFWPLMGDGLRM
jgi:hypothetical protein